MCVCVWLTLLPVVGFIVVGLGIIGGRWEELHEEGPRSGRGSEER